MKRLPIFENPEFDYPGLSPDWDLQALLDLSVNLPPDRKALFDQLMAEMDQMAVEIDQPQSSCFDEAA